MILFRLEGHMETFVIPGFYKEYGCGLTNNHISFHKSGLHNVRMLMMFQTCPTNDAIYLALLDDSEATVGEIYPKISADSISPIAVLTSDDLNTHVSISLQV